MPPRKSSSGNAYTLQDDEMPPYTYCFMVAFIVIALIYVVIGSIPCEQKEESFILSPNDLYRPPKRIMCDNQLVEQRTNCARACAIFRGAEYLQPPPERCDCTRSYANEHRS